MSFYITLPSNSSMELFPNNTMTDFTVILKEPLRLDIQYEVALVELTYKHSWSLQVGRMIVRLTNEYSYDVFYLVYHDGENIKSFVNRLNGEVSEYYIKKEYNRRYDLFKANSSESIALPKSEYNNRDKESNVISEIINSEYFRLLPRFSSDEHRFIMYIPGEKDEIWFDGDITKILNLERRWYFSSPDDKFLKSGVIDDPSPNIIQSLFIYCDIIDYQFVGDSFVPLLRTVVVDNSYLKTAWVHYDNPHYLNVNKSEISSIKVQIRDDNGNKIRFENGKIIAKLHFRPKQL